MARAVVDMAHAMGRYTVAEGVETAEQFHVLRGIGVDAYQGWLFSRPLAPAQLRDAARVPARLETPAAAAPRRLTDRASRLCGPGGVAEAITAAADCRCAAG